MTEALVDRCEEERKEALSREARLRAQRKYRASDKYKATNAKYRASAKGKASRAKYDASDKGKAARAKQAASDKAKAGILRADARRLLRSYGVTEAQYQAMVVRQKGRCVICGRPPKKQRLSVEHDHISGRVRGLACWQCNKYKIGTNTVETARKVLAYLESDFDGRKLVA